MGVDGWGGRVDQGVRRVVVVCFLFSARGAVSLSLYDSSSPSPVWIAGDEGEEGTRTGQKPNNSRGKKETWTRSFGNPDLFGFPTPKIENLGTFAHSLYFFFMYTCT